MEPLAGKAARSERTGIETHLVVFHGYVDADFAELSIGNLAVVHSDHHSESGKGGHYQ